MPRQLQASTTLDDLESEVLFTTAALGADSDAQHLLPMTENWMAEIDDARKIQRESRRARFTASAQRSVSNGRLDATCEDFGDQLYLKVDKDRAAPRWRQFFPTPVSRFVRQSLPRQVVRVRAWLTIEDDVLEPFRNDLAARVDAAQQALDTTEAVALAVGKAQIRRERLTEDLTRERDTLRDALATVAREKNLPRTWPDLFFIKSTNTPTAPTPEDTTPPSDA